MPGIVAANWKMNASSAHVEEFVAGLASLWGEAEISTTAVIMPPAAYLPVVRDALVRHGLAQRVELGGQSLHQEPSGAFTGEISGAMLKDLGASSVIVGHSERRMLFGETDDIVAAKALAALAAGLQPVVCFGESLEQRDAGRAEATVLAQVGALISAIGEARLAQVTLAYEPIWAIGTGRTASPQQAEAMHRAMQEYVPGQPAILYGGSVKPDNAAALFGEPHIDGGLVGGAALEAQSFWQIIQAAESNIAAGEGT